MPINEESLKTTSKWTWDLIPSMCKVFEERLKLNNVVSQKPLFRWVVLDISDLCTNQFCLTFTQGEDIKKVLCLVQTMTSALPFWRSSHFDGCVRLTGNRWNLLKRFYLGSTDTYTGHGYDTDTVTW